mmetsp:Transcript_4759/g.12767  ORF Transcript_4759/g.12767 Transcript_4759/m.12767 type:complete len:228 (+) Transcript_4759:1201-1884(+)
MSPVGLSVCSRLLQEIQHLFLRVGNGGVYVSDVDFAKWARGAAGQQSHSGGLPSQQIATRLIVQLHTHNLYSECPACALHACPLRPDEPHGPLNEALVVDGRGTVHGRTLLGPHQTRRAENGVRLAAAGLSVSEYGDSFAVEGRLDQRRTRHVVDLVLRGLWAKHAIELVQQTRVRDPLLHVFWAQPLHTPAVVHIQHVNRQRLSLVIHYLTANQRTHPDKHAYGSP